MSVNDDNEDEMVVKAINRRYIDLLSNGLFSDYISTYGKEADAKLISFKQLKEMKTIMKKIISTIGIKRSEFSPDIVLALVSETYYDLIELKEVLITRLEIAKLLEQIEGLDEEIRCVFANTYDLDLLRAIKEILLEFDSDKVQDVIDNILNIAEETGFFDIYAEGFIKYHKIKESCVFPNVVEFLDDNISEFYDNDGFDCILAILDEYSKSTIELPFSEKNKSFLMGHISFLNSDVFDKKDESSLIKLINAVFIWLSVVPQYEEQSFEPLVNVVKKNDSISRKLKVGVLTE